MTQYDGYAVAPALEELRHRKIAPASVLGDTHYGSNEVMADAAESGVEIVAPSMREKGYKQGLISIEAFEVDEEGRIVRCPQGQAPLQTHAGKSKLLATFDLSVCASCGIGVRQPLRWARLGGGSIRHRGSDNGQVG